MKIDQLEAKMTEETSNQIKKIAKKKKKIDDMLKKFLNKWKGMHLQKNQRQRTNTFQGGEL
jgi:transcription termination factor NusB